MTKLVENIFFHLKNRTWASASVGLFVYFDQENAGDTSRCLLNSLSHQELNIRRVVYESEIEELNAWEPEAISQHKKRYSDGEVCYIAYWGGRCVHRSWVRVTPGMAWALYPFFKIRLGADSVLVHACATDEKFRGRGIYPAVLSKIIQDFQGKRIYISASIENNSSRKGIERAGFRLVKQESVRYRFGLPFRSVITR